MAPLLRLALVAVLLGVSGCGGKEGRKDVARVSGTVTCNGKPLSEGVVLFAPIPVGNDPEPGKPARGEIGPDGQYTLTTYDEGDGAVIGKHRVTVRALEPDDDEEETAPAKELPCLPADGIEKEVLDTSNTIDIELSE